MGNFTTGFLDCNELVLSSGLVCALGLAKVSILVAGDGLSGLAGLMLIGHSGVVGSFELSSKILSLMLSLVV